MISAATVAVASPAFAADEEQGTRLEEVVVTATKRAENTQNVAGAISVMSGEQVVEKGISRPTDLTQHVPGLNVKTSTGSENPVFTMRGIGLNDVSSINNPTVGIYLDDIFVPFVPMMTGQLFDVERIEVLKGPQGSLYGRNTTGGAVKFISRKPTADTSANARGEYSSWNTLDLEGAVGGRLTDTVNGRIALITRQRQGGYQRNAFNNTTVGGQNKYAGRILLDWTASEQFNAELNLHGSYSKMEPLLREHIGFRDPSTGVITCPAVLAGDRGGCTDTTGYADNDGKPFTSSMNQLYGNDTEAKAWGAVLTLNYELPFATLTAISGYDWFKRHLVDDLDASPNTTFELNSNDKIQVFQQEVRLVSNNSDRLKWVAGAFYSWDNVKGTNEQAVDRLFNTRVLVTNDQTTKSIAVFGNVNYALTDQFSVIGGLRYTDEKKTRFTISEDLASLGNVSVLSPTRGPFVFARQTNKIKNDNISGNVGMQFRPNDDVMLYATAAKGFKSGGFKGAISFNPNQLGPYEPETLYSYEVGFKSTLLDGAMRLNMAAYHLDWKDFQAYSLVQLFNPAANTNVTVVVLTNAGDAKVQGVEADWTWQVTEGLRLNAAANYMHGKIETFNAQQGGVNNKGRRLSNAPNFQFNTSFDYRFQVAEGGWTPYVSGEANYQSKVFFEIMNNPINSEGAYWLVNARVGARSPDGRWNVSLFARNLFDETYIAESRHIDLRVFPSSNIYGEPRSVGISAIYTY